MNLRARILWLIVTLWLCVCADFVAGQENEALQATNLPQNSLQERFRRPVQMCWLVPGRTLAIANRRGHSVSVVDVSRLAVEAEYPLEGEARQIALISGGQDRLDSLVVLQSDPDKILFAPVDDQLKFADLQAEVPSYPAELAVDSSGAAIAVSSIWRRAVQLFDIIKADNRQSLSVRWSVELPFEPRLIQFSPDSSVLIAIDAFAGNLAAFDVSSGKLIGRGNFHGQSAGDVRFLNDSRFLLTHQILHSDGATTAENIAAGRVIENVTQEIEIERAEDGRVRFVPQILSELGEPSHGAADPEGIALTSQGARIIAISGQDELLFQNSLGINLELVSVGDRPMELLLSPDEKWLYCLNQLGESITVVEVDSKKVVGSISLGPTRKKTTRERGEELFYAGEKSRFGWFSCQSCHRDGHTSGNLADTFGDDSAGAPKRVLSLLGGRDNNPWAWNGSMRSLHDQVRKSGETTLRGEGFGARETNDLVAYLHTLDSPPPFRPAQDAEDQQRIDRGAWVFSTQNCLRCHVPPLTFTSDASYDVGLEDEHGQQKFNPPTLIGAGYRRRFFHDGRVTHLRDVFVEYGHQLNDALSDRELKDLVRFLESL